MTIAGAWLLIVLAQASGTAAALHHHALIRGDTPAGTAILVFVLAWLVMVVAMMWPASLHAVHAFRRGLLDLARPRLAVAGFLGASAIVWAGFGLAAFVGDIVVHHVVDTTPWLGARPWLIEAGVLAIAGGYQFMPLKQRYLAACRRPDDRVIPSALAGQSAVRSGLLHGFDCLGSSWALMLVMFASGFASLWSMAALTLLMVYEATGRHGERAAAVAGIALLLAAMSTLSGPFPGVA
jgi:predicted metal-binding membrane protein